MQGRQVTLDHARGAGVLITVEPADRVPTAEDYLKESTAFLPKQKARSPRPMHRLACEPNLWCSTASVSTPPSGATRLRLEYAVLKQTDGGVTVAARIPAAEVAALKPEVERFIRSLSVTRKIEGK